MLENATSKRVVGHYEFGSNVLGVIYDAWYLDFRYLVGRVWHKHKGQTGQIQYLWLKEDLDFVTVKTRLLNVMANDAKYLDARYSGNVRPEHGHPNQLDIRESTNSDLDSLDDSSYPTAS